MRKSIARRPEKSELPVPDGVLNTLRALSAPEDLLYPFATIERRRFIPPEYEPYANADVSIPIGFEQTASRPSTCARFLAAAAQQAGERILEIGCGSGYLLALLAAQQQSLNQAERGLFGRSVQSAVVGIEKRAALASAARRALDESGLQHVLVRCSDGLSGLNEEGQFDVIVLSAAVHQIPEALLYRLTLGGRLIVPLVCSRHDTSRQKLVLVNRVSRVSGVAQASGSRSAVEYEDLGPCEFVLAT